MLVDGMGLKHAGYIELPAHQKEGGFDHAAVHIGSGTLYVAHTSNDAVDIIDCNEDQYARSIPNLQSVAGVLVSNENDLVFTSNRGENTVGIFPQGQENELEKVTVGGRPNGLAFGHKRGHLLAANVAGPNGPEPVTVSVVDQGKRAMIADVTVPGRTRWTVFDEANDRFYVNISKPSEIAVLEGKDLRRLATGYQVPGAGPHGLDLDPEERRLFCACDQGGLFMVDIDSGIVSKVSDLSGVPDVVFYNSALNHLYVTIGDPGVIEVFDTRSLKRVQAVTTELGTHTIAFNPETNKVYAFMPRTHRASVYRDE